EYIIRDMLVQGAKVDSFGVGERLITSSSEPVFGGVYKLAAVEREDGTLIPKIKISENVTKITTPCFKEVWRIFDRETDKAIADVITLNDEVIDDEKPYTIFDPNHTWKRKTVENFRAVRLRTQLFKNGECLYQPRALSAVRAHCLAQVDTLWEEVTRFENPHSYYVDLSQKLWDEKNRLLSQNEY
ncbi:MAG: nicotinate phosphoribosyltransferase, partial [Hominenteromicrobium sp.]